MKKEIVIAKTKNVKELLNEDKRNDEDKLRALADPKTAESLIALKRANKQLPVVFRKPTQEDISFIFSSWLKSYKNSNTVKYIAGPIYYNEQHKLIERLFKTGQVIIACNPNDISQIYGYLFYDLYDGIYAMHFLYVKEIFRGLGVATQLLKESGFKKSSGGLYTHETSVTARQASKYNMVFHPYLLLNYKLTPAAEGESIALKGLPR